MNNFKICSDIEIGVGEVREFSDMDVVLDSAINCRGTLSFNNCTIIYDGNVHAEISLYEKATLKATDCTFIFKGVRQKPLITNGEDEYFCNVIFENCRFEGCFQFVSCTVLNKLCLHNCELENCGELFISSSISTKGEVNISYNSILNSHLTAYQCLSDKEYRTLLSVNVLGDASNIMIDHNQILENKSFKDSYEEAGVRRYSYFSLSSCTLSDSCFQGASNCVRGEKVVNCTFVDCKDVLVMSSLYDKVCKVEDCMFKNCINPIRTDGKSKVDNCEFVCT